MGCVSDRVAEGAEKRQMDLANVAKKWLLDSSLSFYARSSSEVWHPDSQRQGGTSPLVEEDHPGVGVSVRRGRSIVEVRPAGSGGTLLVRGCGEGRETERVPPFCDRPTM